MVRYCMNNGRVILKKIKRFTGVLIGSSQSTDWIILFDLSGIHNFVFNSKRGMD